MGIAAMVVGIIALVASFVPLCGAIVAIPAASIGLILGIVEVILKGKKNKPKGMGIAGIVLNILAVIIAIAWFILAEPTATDTTSPDSISTPPTTPATTPDSTTSDTSADTDDTE